MSPILPRPLDDLALPCARNAVDQHTHWFHACPAAARLRRLLLLVSRLLLAQAGLGGGSLGGGGGWVILGRDSLQLYDALGGFHDFQIGRCVVLGL